MWSLTRRHLLYGTLRRNQVKLVQQLFYNLVIALVCSPQIWGKDDKDLDEIVRDLQFFFFVFIH